jgi:hypothetical protein
MKTIDKSELFQHVNQFLKSKGVEIKDGTYARHLEKSCGLLTDAINLTQRGMERAKTEIDKRLEQMRHVIHEKTAPRSASSPPPQANPASGAVPPKIKTRPKPKGRSRGNSRAGQKAESRKPKRSQNAKGK